MASEFGRKVEPTALLLSEKLAVAVDGGEAFSPCEEADTNEGEQGGNGPTAVVGAGIWNLAQGFAETFKVGFFER